MVTDTIVRDDVLAELDFEPRLNASGVTVTVEDGIVTLGGHVATYLEKLAAEEAAKRVKGVTGIAQDIEVRLAQNDVHDDSEIAHRASQLLAWTVSAPKQGVKVRCENGWVSLSGEVNWGFQRDEAERVIRNLAGVVGVFNHITLRNRVAPGDVKAQIKKALHRNAELDAGGIDVSVDGARVTLSGSVSAWSDRRAAETAAWSIPGVQEVLDHIGVR